MESSELIVANADVLGGAPCFRGTRIPVSVLFDNLADGLTIDAILEAWPSLNRADVVAVLALAAQKVGRAAA